MNTPDQDQLDRASAAAWAGRTPSASRRTARLYYDPAGDYAGSTLLDLQPNDPQDVTATDLYALSLPDVRASPLAGRRLLEDGEPRTLVLSALANADLPASANLLDAEPAMSDAAETLYLAVRDALGLKDPPLWRLDALLWMTAPVELRRRGRRTR